MRLWSHHHLVFARALLQFSWENFYKTNHHLLLLRRRLKEFLLKICWRSSTWRSVEDLYLSSRRVTTMMTAAGSQQTSLFHHSRFIPLAPAAAFKAQHHSSSSSSSVAVVVREQSSSSSLQVRSGRVYSCCSKNFLFFPSLPDAFRGATRQRLRAAARPNSEAIRAVGDSSGLSLSHIIGLIVLLLLLVNKTWLFGF